MFLTSLIRNKIINVRDPEAGRSNYGNPERIQRDVAWLDSIGGMSSICVTHVLVAIVRYVALMKNDSCADCFDAFCLEGIFMILFRFRFLASQVPPKAVDFSESS